MYSRTLKKHSRELNSKSYKYFELLLDHTFHQVVLFYCMYDKIALGLLGIFATLLVSLFSFNIEADVLASLYFALDLFEFSYPHVVFLSSHNLHVLV